ncbi:ABC transporter permease [Agrobacterium vitis]|uniref:ABC transporter permease n=1 Tax=Agrobacterium vitis TaxID=373 RepID=UPI0012E92E8D|nr:ABC transporter permease subunit [Agrobacterium vitis]MVA63880.1 ABC transporter permease subunit [Agrobacterium vitis]MVA71151.1 ABC transporter permease subunit [Agrobacterium vitis]
MRFDWLYNESGRIAELFIWHLSLSVIPVLIGLLLALPLGWLAQRAGVFRSTLLGAAGLLYTIPSLALFVLLPLVLGTRILDPLNVVVALTVYALALLVRTVSDGLDSISPDVLQAANAMGYRRAARLLTVELPLAVPVIAAGLRVAVVSNVSIVSVAALVGTPQLGLLFTQGLQLQFLTPIIAGIVLCVVLAALLDGLVLFIAHRLTPWQPGRGLR